MKTEIRTSIFNIPQTWISMDISEMKSNIIVDSSNYYDCTIANFTEVEVNFIPTYSSESGSQYMVTESGVYRKSNHWGVDVNSCIWTINNKSSNKETIGYCSFENFNKYSNKRDSKNRHSGDWKTIHNNIINMINGEMVLSHRIGFLNK